MTNLKKGFALLGLWAGLGWGGIGVGAADLTPVTLGSFSTPTATAASSPVQETVPTGSITVVPNPLGNEITFRTLVASPALVKISVYDHFFAPVTVLQAKGNGCFDVLWKLKKVQEGIYYFKSQVKDVQSGLVSKMPVQKVVVTK
jgi:hypothetical protein